MGGASIRVEKEAGGFITIIVDTGDGKEYLLRASGPLSRGELASALRNLARCLERG